MQFTNMIKIGTRVELIPGFFFTLKILALLLILFACNQSYEPVETSKWKAHDGNPVLSVGESGSWDAGALGSMTVLKVEDVYHMYYEAWGIRSGAQWDREEYNTLQIGHATSEDGINWRKDKTNNPVIRKGEKGDWDSHGTWDPFVIYEDGIFKMWYGGNNPDCNWGYAESQDGSIFLKKGKISDLGEVEDIHVFHDNDKGIYYLYYWDRYYEPIALFCARSTNEIDFDFENAENISIENDYEEEKYKFTHIVKSEHLWYMFYADFVRPHCDESKTRLALSADGINWKSVNKNLFPGHDAEILPINDTLTYAYYGPNGYFDRKDCDIRLMIFYGGIEEMY